MNNYNPKKRRPYAYGEPNGVNPDPIPASSLSRLSSSPPPPQSSSSSSLLISSTQPRIPAHDFHSPEAHTNQDLSVLQQAASILNCPLPQLLALDQSHRITDFQDSLAYPASGIKRQRLNSHSSQPSSAIVRSSSIPHYQEMPGGFFVYDDAGETMSEDAPGFVQCLTNFSVCSPCATYESPAYAAAPVGSAYGYVPEKIPYRDEEQPTDHCYRDSFPSSSTNADHYKEQDSDSQSLSVYPPLRPNGAMTAQPTTRSQSMVYHNPSAALHYVAHQRSGPSPTMRHLSTAGLFSEGDDYGDIQPRRFSTMHRSNPAASGNFEVADQSRELDIVLSTQRPPAAKRGPFRSNDERERTAETRKIGSCIRCRMQRIRCEIDPNDKHGTCLTCQRVSSVKIWRLPCLRYKITDVRLFKPGPVKGYEWTRRWTEGVPGDISQWESTDTKWVNVTEGYSDHTILLRVRRFVPQDGDSLSRTWVANGQKREVKIPAYAIVDLDEAKSEYDRYIRTGYYDCCKTILHTKAKILHGTYLLAMQAAHDRATPEKERELLMKALQLWMAIRLTTKSTVIVGTETLGMPQDIMDSTSPLHGQIPLPPVMGAQIELVLIHQIQATLRRELLENLQAMTQANKQKTWFTTYLVTFILLHNVSLLCQHDAGYARKHGIQRRFAREDMVREYQLGANILLGYFHYCTKGVYPFSAECKDEELSSLAELDESKTRTIKSTRRIVQLHKKEWRKIREAGDYENDFFYISQLYEEQWAPPPTI